MKLNVSADSPKIIRFKWFDQFSPELVLIILMKLAMYTPNIL